MDMLAMGAEAVSLFCRVNINTRPGLPIRSSEMGLLIFLVKSDAPATSAQAADFFHVSRPMVAAMVRSLEAKGYLSRGTHKTDRRQFLLLPTPKAQALVEQTYADYVHAMALLKEGLGQERYLRLIDDLNQASALLLAEKNNTGGK